MDSVVSADGTRIAFARSGQGPPLVLVHGSTADHTRWAGILPELERHFTVIAMDRRGRGGSGDSEPYTLEREFDDVAAVVSASGDRVSLLGHSFGALCAMEAALKVGNLRRLVLYEPPFPAGGVPLYPPGLPARLAAILERDGPESFLTAFFHEVVGMPKPQIAALRAEPAWTARLAAAPTALREMADGDYRFEPARFGGMQVPTLLLLGETSGEEFAGPTRALDAALPDSRIALLEGQGHVAMTSAPKLFLREVIAFLTQ